MKVKELIETLSKLNPELDVLIAKDAEGNGFSILHEVGINHSYIIDGYCYEVSIHHLTDELMQSGYCKEDVIEDSTECIVLWP